MDALKFILITLVIMGHVPLIDGLIGTGWMYKCDKLSYHTMTAIYAFHMPLFVFLSGLFTKQYGWINQFGKSKKLIILFLLFQSIDLIMALFIEQNGLTLRRIVTPCFALWYLVDLFYWRMMTSMLNRRDRQTTLFVSIALSLLAGYIPIGSEFGFQRFFSFMPYFVVGHYYGQEILARINKIQVTPPQWATVITLLSLIGFCVSFNPYWLTSIISPYSNIYGSVMRLIYILYSSVLSGLILIVMSHIHKDVLRSCSKYGKDTLYIYLLHPYALYTTLLIWQKVDTNVGFVDMLLITIITLIIVMLCTLAIKKIKNGTKVLLYK